MKYFWILILCLPIFCFAESKTEITLYSSISFVSAEKEIPGCIFCKEKSLFPNFGSTQSFENSVSMGFKAGYNWNSNLEIEGSFAVAPARNLRTEGIDPCRPGEPCPLVIYIYSPFPVEQDAVTYYYSGDFLYNFGGHSFKPFLSAGLGGVSTDFEASTHNDFALNFGAGAKFRFRKIGLRLEVIDYVILNHFLTDETEHDLQIQYGFLFGL